jgi:hypothetical protein
MVKRSRTRVFPFRCPIRKRGERSSNHYRSRAGHSGFVESPRPLPAQPPDGLENARFEVPILRMRKRPLILISVVVLATMILLTLRGELSARGPQCGFWGSMEDGISCQ